MLQRELLVPKGSRRRKGRKLKSIGGVTIHNTGNTDRGSTADANARYQKNSANDAVNGWHWTVDDKEAIKSIPEDEIAEHAGKRKGNDTTVGIEIAENKDGDLRKATDNAAELAAQVLKRQGFKKAEWGKNIYQHHDWSGKNCPSRIRAKQPYGWDEFVKKVNQHMGAVDEKPVAPSTPTPKPEQSTDGEIKNVPHLSRNIKLTSPMMRGEDVRIAQERLNALGFNAGKADGIFGKNTKSAVTAFQKAEIQEGFDLGRSGADGIIGKKTWKALWE